VSRYPLHEAFDDSVGLDPPTGRFFYQSFDYEGELEDEAEFDHLTSLLLYLAGKGIEVPDETVANLVADSVQPWSPGPLQEKLGFEARP
jgi:hypothetical protein